jgi:hypothetical protein
MTVQQRYEQRAVATTDVDDRLVAAPLNRFQALQPSLPALSHRAVECAALLRVRRQP